MPLVTSAAQRLSVYDGVVRYSRAHILETSWENLRKISYLRKIIGKYLAKR